jgi:RND family efflux transporter MFP subunit
MSTDKEALDGLRIDRTRTRAGSRSVGPWLLAILLLVIAAGGGVFWFVTRPKAAVVRTIAVQEKPGGGQKTLLNASGYVTARRQATVSSKVTGKVVEVLVEEGMKVEAGQVLARIDSVNVQAALRLSEAQLESARQALKETKANLHQAQRELERFRKLEANNIASASDVDRADASAKSLAARLDHQQSQVVVAEREVAQWQQQLDDTVVRAPFAGIVTVKNAQPGEMISPMSAGGSFTRTGICTLVDMTSLEIEVDVNESYINRVEAGQRVAATLDSYPDSQIPSKVIAIIPTADRQKATVKVRVGFDKLDKRILPDMGVKVAFQGNMEETAPAARSLAIPKTAVYERDGRSVVWLVRDGRVESRAVTVGAQNGDEITIAAGLNSGERVVVEGAEGLVDGRRVTEAKR